MERGVKSLRKLTNVMRATHQLGQTENTEHIEQRYRGIEQRRYDDIPTPNQRPPRHAPNTIGDIQQVQNLPYQQQQHQVDPHSYQPYQPNHQQYQPNYQQHQLNYQQQQQQPNHQQLGATQQPLTGDQRNYLYQSNSVPAQIFNTYSSDPNLGYFDAGVPHNLAHPALSHAQSYEQGTQSHSQRYSFHGQRSWPITDFPVQPPSVLQERCQHGVLVHAPCPDCPSGHSEVAYTP